MDEEQVVRLGKPKRKGLLSLIFSRFFIILLLLIAQVLLYVGIFRWFHQYAAVFYAVTLIFTVVMLVYLFMCGMDA